jgi:hypothetical protein
LLSILLSQDLTDIQFSQKRVDVKQITLMVFDHTQSNPKIFMLLVILMSIIHVGVKKGIVFFLKENLI